jgi:hypothetical protein
MKTKFEIVKDLVDNRLITFEEGLIFLDWKLDKPQATYRASSPYTATITTTKTTPSEWIFKTNSELEDK